MPSSAVVSDQASGAVGFAADEPLIAAAVALVARGAFGALWLDPELRVKHVVGGLSGKPARGTPVTDVLLALVGLEDDITALRAKGGDDVLRIPNTAVAAADGSQSQRLDVTLFWIEQNQQFLVLLGTVHSGGSPTIELDQEIRRRRLVEQDLAAKSQEYARINEQLEEFAYVISHDLNAPLRALRYLSTDIQSALDAEADGGERVDHDAMRRAAAAIITQTRRMSQMMMDLLDYARIGRVEEAVGPVDTRALVEAVFRTLEPTTPLKLEMAGSWPHLVTAAAPLDMVLRNLIENAVKHHDRPRQGRVLVQADIRGAFVEFQIIDDGRGIPEDWQQAIFEPFRKVDDAHHPESSGIGLALVKKMVTTLGGTIEVLSNAPVSRGTTFFVRWPLKLANPEDAASEFR
jgi:signal transduction histidine kinase